MAATLAPSMAIALQTAPTASRASVMPPKSKDDFLGAGRRKLDKFREKRANAKTKASANYEQKENEKEKENSSREQHSLAVVVDQPVESMSTAASVLQALPTLSVHALTSSDKTLRGQKERENEKPASSTLLTGSSVLFSTSAQSDREEEKRSHGESTSTSAPLGANSLVSLPWQPLGSGNENENEKQGPGTLGPPTSHPAHVPVVPTWPSTKPSFLVRRLSEGSLNDHKADENREKDVEKEVSGTLNRPTSHATHVAADTTWLPSRSPSKLSSLVRQSSEGSISDLKADEKENENSQGHSVSQSYVERPVDSFLLQPAVPEAPLAASNTSNGSLYMHDQGHVTSKNDDFDALEQHIEDLTQEKFALQRGLDKSRKLVETLTQDNATLTEDYNQQAARVNELKEELARCQEYIRTQMIELQSLKGERDKAQQQIFIAKEHSRSLAAETIQVEESYRRTRSQELKLQREVESLRDEIESLRKQNASIEKDRANAIAMNEAMQEEKKVLLSRIREAADKVGPAPVAAKQDVSTTTDDLITEYQSSTSEPEPETTEDFGPLYPTSLPAEQLAVLENINGLIDELGREKETILRALRNETETVNRLKSENAELSQKLERQTQQLELAVAQNMARAGSLPSPPVFQTSEEIDFIDEGDEIVDRVLGWIMRLFPKRGGAKHL